MNISLLNIVRLIAAAGFVITISVGSHAQPGTADRSVIRQARAIPASRIEKGLPAKRFDRWVQDVAGRRTAVSWQVNDCGRPAGIPEDHFDENSPVCIKITAPVAEQVILTIYIEFASYRRGVISMPFVRYVFVGDRAVAGGAEYGDLRSMGQQLSRIARSLEFFDPNDGDFRLPATGPGAFENISELLIETMVYNSKGINVPVRTRGTLYAADSGFKMRDLFFDGKRLSFKTASVNGVSFGFDGAYESLKVDSHGAYTPDTALKGHMVKFLNGKKVSEADLVFNYESYPGC